MTNSVVKNDLENIFNRFPQPELFKGKTVLISGFAGFLGFYLTHYFIGLSADGMAVDRLILLDSFILGRPDWVEALRQDPRVEIHPFEVSKDNISLIASAAQADYVIHLASVASPVYYRQYPLQTIDANVGGLRKLLDFYAGKQLRGFLLFSSSEIYGNPSSEAIPTPEDYFGYVSCTGPRACYDEAKRFSETLGEVFYQTVKLPVRIVRPFNNYGPGMRLDDGRVPADFAQAVMQGRDLVIYSDGSPTRTFCYVTDAVVGYLKALTHSSFDIFNIGMDQPEIRIDDLARLYQRTAKKLLNYQGQVMMKVSADKDYLTNSPLRRCPSIAKARQILGYAPVITPEVGVERFLNFLLEENKV